MTEQKAIEKLNMLDEALNFQRHDADECSLALQIAIEALEKQIPKKPYRGRCGVLCPTCSRQEYIKQIDALDIYCGFCGQRIDWSEE